MIPLIAMELNFSFLIPLLSRSRSAPTHWLIAIPAAANSVCLSYKNNSLAHHQYAVVCVLSGLPSLVLIVKAILMVS